MNTRPSVVFATGRQDDASNIEVKYPRHVVAEWPSRRFALECTAHVVARYKMQASFSERKSHGFKSTPGTKTHAPAAHLTKADCKRFVL